MVNQVVKHVYPVKASQIPDNYKLPNGHRRPHVHGEEAASCWCGPTVLEWSKRPDGRMGWVVVEPGVSDPHTTAIKIGGTVS